MAVFIPSLGGGGAERAMLLLTEGLAGQGVKMDVVVGNADGPYRDEVPSDVRLIDLKATRMLSGFRGLVSYMRAARPACLISTPVHANIAAVWARAFSRVPLRLVVREANTLSVNAARSSSRRARLLPRLARWSYGRADAIVAVSAGVADDLSRCVRIEARRITVIPNPVVTDDLFIRAREPVDHPWFVPGGTPVVLAAGRLEPQKDYPTLIRAFVAARGKMPCRLMILGEGAERSALEAMAMASPFAGDIALPGFVGNPFAYMEKSSLFVLSSRHEGLPNAMIQAAALGVPVVATDCPSGPREIVDGGARGTLVSVGDAHGMAAAMLAWLGDARPREKAPAGLIERYNQKNVTQQYLSLIEAVTSKS